MNTFLASRKQLRAERAHRRAIDRATANVSSRAVRREMMVLGSGNYFGV